MRKQMHSPSEEFNDDLARLAEDARALLAATAGIAGEKVEEARKRLAAALDDGKSIYERAKEKATDGARAADEAMHEHPYRAIATGLGVGALLGFLIARRCHCSCHVHHGA